MRILVTGGTGFIGSHLVRRFLREGSNVAVLLRKDSDTWRIKDVLPQVEIIRGDLTSIPKATSAIRAFRPEVVTHLAWDGATSYKFQNEPLQALNNVNGSLQLAQLAGEIKCRSFIGLGSVLEYGKYAVPLSEDVIPQPQTFYGRAKYGVGLLLEKLCETYGMQYTWFRLFWSYGPADSQLRMIPQVILSLLREEKPALSPGDQLWDYIYVSDVVNALYLAAVNTGIKGNFNLGSGESNTVRSIVERIRDLINPSFPLGLGDIPYRTDQIMHLKADVTRLKQAARWSPQVNLDDGLKKTVEWYRENLSQYEK